MLISALPPAAPPSGQTVNCYRGLLSGSCWSQRIWTAAPRSPSAAEPAGTAEPRGLRPGVAPSEPRPDAGEMAAQTSAASEEKKTPILIRHVGLR